MNFEGKSLNGYSLAALVAGTALAAWVAVSKPSSSLGDAIKREGCELSAIDEPSLLRVPKNGNVGYNATTGECTYTYVQDDTPKTQTWDPK